MKVTEVRIKLVNQASDRLFAYCSITLDQNFVVRDLKVIGSGNGYFVAMPSRRVTVACPGCRFRNHLQAAFCNFCGGKLRPEQNYADGRKIRHHVDIAHPINSSFRREIEEAVLSAFRAEVELAQQPGYQSRYNEYYDDEVQTEEEFRRLDAPHQAREPKRSISPGSTRRAGD